MTSKNKRRNGIRNKRIKNIYYEMKKRCYNPNNKGYKWYGAKGIKICQEWLENPYKFEEWALSSGYYYLLTIDRIDPDGDYCPENCRWITRSENTKRSSSRYYLTIDDVTQCLKDWSKVVDLDPSSLYEYYHRHGEIETIDHIINRMIELKKLEIAEKIIEGK